MHELNLEQNMYSFLITDPKSWIKANKENLNLSFMESRARD